jgi:hypothetical protein
MSARMVDGTSARSGRSRPGRVASSGAATVTPSPRLDAAAATSRVRSARDRSMGQFTTRPQRGRLGLEQPAELES